MYNFLSLIILGITLMQIGRIEPVYFVTLCAVSVGLALAGAISSLGTKFENLFFTGLEIKTKEPTAVDTKIEVRKIRYMNSNDEN